MLVIVLETSENLYIFCDILLKNSEKVNNMINELKSPATSFFIKSNTTVFRADSDELCREFTEY